MFPVTVELGESMAGAFNALTPVPMTDGGRRLCARDLLIRSSHFRIRRLSFSRASADSHDPFSVFKAMVDIMFWRLRVLAGASSQGPRFCGRIVSLWALVGLPLIDTLDSSPRVSTRALALGWRLFRRWSFRGVARATPAGVAPEPLEESLTPSRVMLLFLMEVLSISPFSKSHSPWKRGFEPQQVGFALGS